MDQSSDPPEDCRMIVALAAVAVFASAAAPAEVARPVASIVSPIWSNPERRDQAHEVEQIVARLALRPGMTVADVGAGSGYDTLRLAKVVGPRGRVFAEDVTPAYISDLRSTVAAAGANNVTVIEGSAGDPRLPPRSIDAAIMVHMYHEIQQPMALLSALAPAFRAGGRLGIEELDRPTLAHGTPLKLLVCELAAAGYRLIQMSALDGGIGYFAVFQPLMSARAPSSRQSPAAPSGLRRTPPCPLE
jgi:protein-L-isoaspartate O-methyltransferase